MTSTGDGTAAIPRPPGTALLTTVVVAVVSAAVGVLFRTHDWYVALSIAVVVAAAGTWLGSLALKQHWMLGLVVIVVSGPLLGAVGSAAWADWAMDRDGEVVTAVVTEADLSNRSQPYYTLRRSDRSGPLVKGGQLAPVRHLESGERARFDEGDKVKVLEDPDGAYRPVLPADTQPTLWAGAWTLLAMVLWGFIRPVLKWRPSTTPPTQAG